MAWQRVRRSPSIERLSRRNAIAGSAWSITKPSSTFSDAQYSAAMHDEIVRTGFPQSETIGTKGAEGPFVAWVATQCGNESDRDYRTRIEAFRRFDQDSALGSMGRNGHLFGTQGKLFYRKGGVKKQPRL